MNNCKNCKTQINKNRIYCSLKCRNIYVNKYLRDYTKNGKTNSDKSLNKYLSKPKICKECGEIIKYEKRENIFCNSSCSATHTNKIRVCSKYKLSKVGLENIRKATEKRFNFLYDEYSKKPNNCIECKNELSFLKRKNKFCNKKCQNIYDRKHLNEYQKYHKSCQFKFSLNDFPNEFNFKLIEEYGWYKAKNHGDNLNGVSRDHMISIKEGFELGIDSGIISHPANCKLMQQKKNSKKHKNSSINVEELKERINKWNNKH